MKVLKTFVLVEIETKEGETTAGGIFIPGSKTTHATVKGVGTGVKGNIKVGDDVRWDKNARFATVKRKLDEKDLFFFDEKDLICVVEN